MTWRDRAACKGALEVMMPEGCDLAVMASQAKLGRLVTPGVREAKAICRRCPVQPECLEEAVVSGYSSGVFGGMDPYERWLMAKARGIQFDDDEQANVG